MLPIYRGGKKGNTTDDKTGMKGISVNSLTKHKLEMCPVEHAMDEEDELEEFAGDGEPDDQEVQLQEAENQSREPRALRKMVAPTEEQRITHNLTHANYEQWCEHCVAGRGDERAHARATEGNRSVDECVVQMDYMFVGTDGVAKSTAGGDWLAEHKDSIPIIVAVDDRGVVEACMCTKKEHRTPMQ